MVQNQLQFKSMATTAAPSSSPNHRLSILAPNISTFATISFARPSTMDRFDSTICQRNNYRPMLLPRLYLGTSWFIISRHLASNSHRQARVGGLGLSCQPMRLHASELRVRIAVSGCSGKLGLPMAGGVPE